MLLNIDVRSLLGFLCLHLIPQDKQSEHVKILELVSLAVSACAIHPVFRCCAFSPSALRAQSSAL